MQEHIQISSIIISWNTRDLLLACLESISSTIHAEQEIIVVDNASQDGSAAAAQSQYPSIQVIQNPINRGYAPANNQAIQISQGDFLLLINADAEVLPGAVDQMLAFMELHPACGVVGPRLLNSDKTLQQWTAGSFPSLGTALQHFLFLDRILPDRGQTRGLYLRSDVRDHRRVDWVSSACFLIRTQALREVGGKLDDTYFAYMEDVALCEKMKKAGWETWYLPSANVIHHMGQSTKRQTGKVSPNSVRSFHQYFLHKWGKTSTRILQGIEVFGYSLRVILYGLGALILRRPKWRQQTSVHKQYLAHVWSWRP